MNDGLRVGRVGRPVVGLSTDELRAVAHFIELSATECADVGRRLTIVHSTHSPALAADVRQIEAALRRTAERCSDLANNVRLAAELYEATERRLAATMEGAASTLATTAGLIISRLGLVALPGIVTAAATGAAVSALSPAALHDAAAPITAYLVSDPILLEALRVALSSLDDAMLGAMGLPPALAVIVGETGTAHSSLEGVASLLAAAATIAGIRGTGQVVVDQVGADRRRDAERDVVPAPDSLAERIARIPEPRSPIVIERFTLPDGAPHIEVYIAGTDPDAQLGGEHPWDMASNVALVAQLEASSLQAVRLALAAEGVNAQTSIVFTGYSQGGAIATALAESGDYNTTGLVTVGAPTGGMPVRGSYPAVVIEHHEDLVPTLSGLRRETSAVIVRADALDASSRFDDGMPAHDRDRYLQTAAAADRLDSPALQAARDALPRPVGSGVRSVYTANRLGPPSS